MFCDRNAGLLDFEGFFVEGVDCGGNGDTLTNLLLR